MSIVTISKTFDFDAAHSLPLVEDGHKCRRMHGHTYRVEIICAGKLDRRGMVCDYAEIAAAWAPLHALLDHRVLNEVDGLQNPTTEVLVLWILDHLRVNYGYLPVTHVRVYESSTTWCEATP